MSDIENDSSYANLQPEDSTLQTQLNQAKQNAKINSLQSELDSLRSELSQRKARNEDTKKNARAKLEEVSRTFQTRVVALESENSSLQEKMRVLEKSKSSTAKELEANLAQTISLYSLVQQHQNTIDQQRIKCEYSDAQYNATVSKLKSAEKEMTRLRLLIEKEHDSNERHIQAQKGQLSLKTDECLKLGAKLSALEEEYKNHRLALEQKIEKLEKERSLLEAVNFELREVKEKNYQLNKDNEDMKQNLLKKAHLEGQYDAALQQIQNMSATINRLEDERAKWAVERRDLDQELGSKTAEAVSLTKERDAAKIEIEALNSQLSFQAVDYRRQLETNHEAALKRQEGLKDQLASAEQHSQQQQAIISQLEADGNQLRAEQKKLLDQIALLEASLRDANKNDASNKEVLHAAQKQTEELRQNLKASQAEVDQLAQKELHSTNTIARIRSSAEALVERLDTGYYSSYMAQAFLKWKMEHRMLQQSRALESRMMELENTQAQKTQVEEALKQSQLEKEEMERNSESEREVLSKTLKDNQAEMIRRAKIEWEEQKENEAFKAKEEARDREKRITEERERIRSEVIEARERELEAIKASENSRSIARRPSIQSLVGHVVHDALRKYSPDRRRHSSSPSDRSHYTQASEIDSRREYERSRESRDKHRSRSKSKERRKHRHHHHHHSRDISPRSAHHHHHGGIRSSSRHRSASPMDVMPPVPVPQPQPFALPAHYAPFVSQMPADPIPSNVPSVVGAVESPNSEQPHSASSRPSLSRPISAKSSVSQVAAAREAAHAAMGTSGSPTRSRAGSKDSSATNTSRMSARSKAASPSSTAAQVNIPPLPLHAAQLSRRGSASSAVSTRSTKSTNRSVKAAAVEPRVTTSVTSVTRHVLTSSSTSSSTAAAAVPSVASTTPPRTAQHVTSGTDASPTTAAFFSVSMSEGAGTRESLAEGLNDFLQRSRSGSDASGASSAASRTSSKKK